VIERISSQVSPTSLLDGNFLNSRFGRGLIILGALSMALFAGTMIASENWYFAALPVALLAALWLALRTPYQVLAVIIVEAAFNYAPYLYNPGRVKTSDLVTQGARDVLLLLLVVCWLVRLLAERRGIPGLPRDLVVPVAFWVGWMFVRSLHGDTTPAYVFRLLRHLTIYPLVLMLVVADVVKTDRQRVGLWRVLLLAGWAVALIAIAEGVFGFSQTRWTDRVPVPESDALLIVTNTRAISTLLSPNNLCGFLALLIIVIVVLHGHGLLNRILPARLGYVILACALWAMAYSLSRGPVAALILTSPWLLRLQPSQRLRSRIGQGLVVLLLVGVLYVVLNNSNSYRGSLDTNPRVSNVQTNLPKLTASPSVFLVGYGMGYGKGDLSDPEMQVVSSDLWLIVLLGSAGLIGLAFFCYYYSSLFRALRRLERQHQNPVARVTCRIGLAYLWFAFFWGFGAVSFNLFPLSFYLWIIVGAGLATSSEVQPTLGRPALAAAQGA
jgi:hypothetical protein